MLTVTLYKNQDNVEHEYSIHDLQMSLFDLYHLNVVSRKNGRVVRETEYSFSTQAERDNKVHELFMNKIKEGYYVRHDLPGSMEDIEKYSVV